MKRKNFLFLLLALLFAPWAANAQLLAEYTVTVGSETYTSIANADLLLANVNGDAGTETVTLPFGFPFGENYYTAGTTLTVRADGYIYFGSSTPGHSSKNAWTNTTSEYYLIAPFLNYDGKITASGATSGAYCTTDDPDNPTVLIIEFKELQCYYSPNGSYNFQVRLYPNGNISTIYGSSTLSTNSSATHNFFLNAKADKICLTGSYAAPVAGTPSSLPNFTTAPVEGQVITYVRPVINCPNPMTLVASDVTAHSATMTWTMDDETAEYQFNLEYKKTTEGDNEWHRIGLGNTRTYTLDRLDAETEYQVRIQTACDPENTGWKNGNNFTTLVACPAPTGLAVTDASITANEATVTWEGTSSDGYVVMVGQENCAAHADFETGDFSQADFTNDATYPWTVVANTHSGAYCAKSATGNNSATTALELSVNLATDMTLSFSAKVSSEANYDKAYFSIDGTVNINGISGSGNWIDYSYPLTPGTHTLRWYYTKDSSVGSFDDCFYVDDIVIKVNPTSWTEYTTTAQTYTFENLTPNTSYQAKVKGNCGDEGYSAETAPVSFTTLPSCYVPTGLAIVENSLTAHEVTIAWDAEEGDWFEYVLTTDASVTPETVNFNTLTQDHNEHWNNLPGDTDHFFFLRKKCSDTDFSEILTLTFHTLEACPAPTGFAASNITAHTADLTWEGSSNTYYVTYGAMNTTATVLSTDFENNAIPAAMTNSTSYAWTVTAGGANNSGYCAIPGNNGVDSSTSDLTFVVTGPGTVSFMAKVSSESGWDYGRFLIDNTQQVNISGTQDWTAYSYELTEGTHTLVWRYYKDVSGASGSDLFYVDDITVTGLTVGEWQTVETTEVPFTLERLTAETSYQVTMYGDCGSEGTSISVGPITFTTDIACHAPTAFQVIENSEKHDQVGLTWTSDATAWQLCLNGDEDNLINIEEEDVTINEGVVTYTLTGLTATTNYSAKLRANCGDEDGVSDWTSSVAFTTSEECPTPTNLNISNIGHFTANATWAGESESFKVTIGTISEATPFNTQNFENESLEAFTNDETNAWVIWSENPNNGSFCMASGNYNVSSSTSTITLTAEFASDGIIEFYSRVSSEGGTYDYGYFSIDGEEQYREGGETPNVWTKRSYEVSAGTHTFSWIYRKDSSVNKGEDRYFIDDVVLSTTTYAWTTYTTQDNAYSFEGLEAGSIYKVKVSPSCDETSESDIVSFTTVSENEKYFITEGDWSTAANWEPAGAPTIEQNVTLFANATITGEAEALSIAGTGTGENNYTLTIEDGGKLKHLNSGVRATVKKTIRPYSTNYDADTYNNGDYYLIANPITSNYTPTEDNGFLVGNYDLYSWDYTNDDEWRNYDANTFSNLNSASYTSYGYLYANETGTDLIFTGTIKAANASLSKSCTATSSTSYDFPGWFLLGNSFVCDAYLAAGSATGNALPFIRMNETGDGFENVAAGSVIPPLEGVFFQASYEEGGYSGNVYVTTTQPTVQSEGKLNMNLRKGNKQLDNAILVFGGNQQMGKMTFRANSSRVYMPVEGKDYAIVSTESNIGEMPVSFKAENNGSYTLSFNADEVSFAYLHLIDNMTGVETDLLATPSYSFEASTTDYESRFKLVFATGNNANDDAFAFYSNGNFVINNEGNATLQVIDVDGRILKSENINGCANVNVKAAAGVYMLRLVNGNDVKVQKVVVR